MDLYEHMGKDLFRAQGIVTPRGIVATTAEEAADATRELGGRSVVKVQVQVGGRGKGGGVVLVDSPERAGEEAARMLGSPFKGHRVVEILVEELLPIAREFYTSLLLDRSTGRYLLMMTAEGGVDIETLAAERPEAIRRVHVDPGLGLRPWHLRRLTATLPADAREGAADVLRRCFEIVQERDATLVEVNPLVQLEDGTVVALDAKVTIDDNALFRHPDLEALAARFPIDPVEQRAKDADLQYVKLDGEVGIIGNGAGLVMSTLDVVAQAGARAANFLDIGGGASADTMAISLEVILSRSLGARGLHQHLRRDHPVRRGGERHPRSARPGGGHGSVGGAFGRDERGGGPPDPGRGGASSNRPGRHDGRGGGRGGPPGEGRGVSVLVGAETRLVVQGITGSEGTFHTLRDRAYGTKVVAGVTPGKGGQDVEGIPVLDTVADAVDQTGANTSMIFVPPRFAADAILEAADAGVALVVCITEGIPVTDMARAHAYLRGTSTTLVGPNCPGVITPGVANVGIIPGEVCAPGRVGFVSRSGTLVYQIVHELTSAGIGQSTCIGMGGDPVHGVGFIEALTLFEDDPGTDLMIMTGEIGGDDEERAAIHRPGACTQAGRRLHRRVRGAAGQADGPCRRDRHGLERDRGREGRGVGGRGRARRPHPLAGRPDRRGATGELRCPAGTGRSHHRSGRSTPLRGPSSSAACAGAPCRCSCRWPSPRRRSPGSGT